MALLLIDDDVELCRLLRDYLRTEGFELEVLHAFDAQAYARLAPTTELIVLDVGLPGMNGFDVLRHLRRDSAVPVIMLTARGDDVDRIVGLELGADDYLPKPCNPRELAARIRAILRRAAGTVTAAEAERLQVAGVELNPAARTVRMNGQDIETTSTEFNVLERLMRDAGRVVPKDVLSRDALGRRLQPFDRAIDMHVSSLRRKLGEQRVRTVRGVGYQFSTEA